MVVMLTLRLALVDVPMPRYGYEVMKGVLGLGFCFRERPKSSITTPGHTCSILFFFRTDVAMDSQ